VRLHRGHVANGTWIELQGLPVTRPSRIASDLLADNEDPAAVGHIIADALRQSFDDPSNFAEVLAPNAARFGLWRGDGLSLLRWLLDLVGDPNTTRWMEQARAHMDHVEDTNTQGHALTAGDAPR
jgi:hypothetical protein